MSLRKRGWVQSHRNAEAIQSWKDAAMKSTSISVMVAVTATVFALILAPATAQQRIVATVDGVAITEADVLLAERDARARIPGLAEMASEARQRVLIQYLIEIELMAAAAKAARLDSSQAHADRVRYDLRQALARQFVEKQVLPVAQPAGIQRAYDAEAAAYKPVEEVHVRLIQVETQAQAAYLRSEIVRGGDFAEFAQALSLDQATRASGGDLGYVAKGEMKEWLEKMAFALGKGQVSPPVKAPEGEGWVVLRVEDRRMRSVPQLGAVKGQIASSLIEARMREQVAALRQKARIVIAEPPR